jgi:hypothetical protein
MRSISDEVTLNAALLLAERTGSRGAVSGLNQTKDGVIKLRPKHKYSDERSIARLSTICGAMMFIIEARPASLDAFFARSGLSSLTICGG